MEGSKEYRNEGYANNQQFLFIPSIVKFIW
jgi:hypothetical protein